MSQADETKPYAKAYRRDLALSVLFAAAVPLGIFLFPSCREYFWNGGNWPMIGAGSLFGIPVALFFTVRRYVGRYPEDTPQLVSTGLLLGLIVETLLFTALIVYSNSQQAPFAQPRAREGTAALRKSR